MRYLPERCKVRQRNWKPRHGHDCKSQKWHIVNRASSWLLCLCGPQNPADPSPGVTQTPPTITLRLASISCCSQLRVLRVVGPVRTAICLSVVDTGWTRLSSKPSFIHSRILPSLLFNLGVQWDISKLGSALQVWHLNDASCLHNNCSDLNQVAQHLLSTGVSGNASTRAAQSQALPSP